MKDRTELMRQLVDMSIACGRKRQSSQTGFIHHCYSAQEGDTHLPIPIVENLLFCLALLKSRTMENVAEAKELLERILHFQNSQQSEMGFGNFPIYIHDYPICKDRFVSAHVGLILYRVLKQFHQILGQPLKGHVETALKYTVQHALQSMSEKAVPYPIAIKIAATAKATGVFLNDSQLEKEGDNWLVHLQTTPDISSWMCPSSLGTILLALNTVYPNLNNSPWSVLWTHVVNTWHQDTACYVGPALKEWQFMSEPQPTVYDLYMGTLSGGYSDRALKDSLVHLEAVLIYPTEDNLPEPVYPCIIDGFLGDGLWTMYKDKKISYSMLKKDPAIINPATEKGYHLLRMIWGDLQRVHSFVCPGGNYRQIAYEALSNGFSMHIELGSPPPEDEEREKTREIAFYGDSHADFSIVAAGERATTFQIEDEVVFLDKELQISMQFSLEKGEGKFLGHRMFSNRPSQMAAKGIHRYETYDWTVFLRTLQRSEDCAIKVYILFTEMPKE